MSRFAAIIARSADADVSLPAQRVAADLVRRTRAATAAWSGGAARLWQGGAPDPAQPQVHRLGPLAIAGDLGLTDLADLRAALSLGGDAGQAEVILHAWLRWGEDALPRLCGAFAFVIWDERSRRLTAVRDRFGIRPLVHAAAGGRVILGGDLSTVIAGLDREPEVNPVWVADFLSGQQISHERTAYAGVHRLPPGHLMTVEADGGIAQRAWYRLDQTSPPQVRDPAEALRAALSHATRQACACAPHPAATFLSGGLDSTTLALMSVLEDGQSRPAISMRYSNPVIDEGRYINDVLARSGGRLTPVQLPGEVADGELFDADAWLDEQDQPIFAPGLTSTRNLYAAVRGAGCGAVLDGHGGDEVIGGTFMNIVRLAGAGHWAQALGLTAQNARFTGDPLMPSVGILLAGHGKRGFGRLGRFMLRGGTADGTSWRAIVADELVAETDLVARVQAWRQPPQDASPMPDGVHQHARTVTIPLIGTAFEILDRAARRAGVTPLYPFYDHRVVELCVWQDEAVKIARGQTKALLRAATQGLLPDSVRLRSDKTNFITGSWAELKRDPGGLISGFRREPGVLEGYVNPDTLRLAAARVLDTSEANAPMLQQLWRAIWLAAWLRRRDAGQRPALEGAA